MSLKTTRRGSKSYGGQKRTSKLWVQMLTSQWKPLQENAKKAGSSCCSCLSVHKKIKLQADT